MAKNYYRQNIKILTSVEEFGDYYLAPDAINWCFRSPFPSRFIRHAFDFQYMAQLNLCRFLISDISNILNQQPKHSSTTQLYRGMKLPRELVEQFSRNVGQLVCTSWLFTCTKSRLSALTAASSTIYRPDFISVFFKIDCDLTASYYEVSKNVPSPVIVFNIYTPFRILYVTQDSMVIVKLKTASGDGVRMAHEYKEKYGNISMEKLLDQIKNSSKLLIPQQLTQQSATNKGTEKVIVIKNISVVLMRTFKNLK